MNEEKAKAAVKKMQRQIKWIAESGLEMDSASWGYEDGVLITGNEAKALIELWNFYQMYKPR